MTKPKTPKTTRRLRIKEHLVVRAGDLVPSGENWRIHTDHQRQALSTVLDELGYLDELKVVRRRGKLHIVDGHLRASLDPDEMVPVAVLDLTVEEARAALASFDWLTGLAEVDLDALSSLMAEVDIGSERLRELFAEAMDGMSPPEPAEGKTDPDDVPPVPSKPITQPGDLWLLGEHRLLCGDSTKADDVVRLMTGERAALMWTDPPYGVSYVGKTADALEIANDGADGLPALRRATFAACGAALAEGAPFYIARPAGALSIAFGNAIDGAGWQLHEELQWVKDSMVLGHSDYHLRHETIMYGWLPGAGRSGRGKHEGSRWYGGNAETSVFEIPRPKASPDHPTGKPVELVERHVANSSRHGDIVLDPFLGSGTTLIACERLGRRGMAIEIDPKYVDVAVRRWCEFTGRDAIRENDGAAWSSLQ